MPNDNFFHCQRTKLLTIYRSVDDCAKGSPALKAYVVHVISQKFCCFQT